MTIDTEEFRGAFTWMHGDTYIVEDIDAHIARIDAHVTEQIETKEQEILRLHCELAGERLRADQGWKRYEEANRDRNGLRMQMANNTSPCYHWLTKVMQNGTPAAKAAAQVLKDYYEGAG